MKVRPLLQKLLLALGVLAVVSAQLFGVGIGFLCDCSGRPVATAKDHCHGPHGAHCLEQEEPAHTSGSHPADSDTIPHSRIAHEFQSPSAPAADLVLAAPVLPVVLVLDDSIWAKAVPVRAVKFAADLRGSPPPGVAVARTVVLLI